MFGRRDMTKKRKTLKEWLQARTYMQVSLALFTVSILLFLLCIWRSIASAGTIGLGMALIGLLSFILAAWGLGVTLFGHFVVRMEGKIKWIAGIITNGMMVAIWIIFYIAGIGG